MLKLLGFLRVGADRRRGVVVVCFRYRDMDGYGMLIC